jgi:hypothetical protein
MPNLAIGWAVIPVENLGKVCIVACKIPTMAASLWLQNCKLLSKFKKQKLHFPSSCPSSVFVSSSSLQFPVRLNLFSISALSSSSQCLHHLFHLFSAKNIYKAQKPKIVLHLNLFSISSISSQQNDAQSLKPQNSSSSQSLIHLFNLFFFIFSTSKNNVQNPES